MRTVTVSLLVLILAAVLIIGGTITVQAGNAARQACIASVTYPATSPAYWAATARC